ncbi:hypothetical protein QNI19_37210 [Cytophagaceae bacterium DM2B3-1]|uniref:Uncharacterized protein n=1 Tax=Xanthocytophaga flava TaxID=3048013 RepID=A0ABT7CXY9_9BACT|nr:hypothetical protein [Xanthocytophaga flavus]MDJ1467122.1 hypothetical protein [Xanthocytophaga flavus]MDJ1498634.1 hypothetical protein [Xanthocytophaga flavus]
MKKVQEKIFLFLIFSFLFYTAQAQNEAAGSGVKLFFPGYANWNTIEEGKELVFTLRAAGGTGSHYTFAITQGKQDGMDFDTSGYFAWKPEYNFVDRLNKEKSIQVIFEARNDKGESASQTVEFKVKHVNQPPTIGDMKTWYVGYNTPNKYVINPGMVKDEDNDPIVFVPTDNMPEGMQLNAQGEFTWKPSLTQFNALKAKAMYIDFIVEDQPGKLQNKGRIRIEATQQDLPPEITIVPKETFIKSRENSPIDIRFYIADPNGDDDVTAFDFISASSSIPKDALQKITTNRYEFIWKPGYDFVKDPNDSLSTQITFFALDKSQKRAELKVNFLILNTVDEQAKDLQLYTQYRVALVRAWDLLEQLKAKEQELKRAYKRAKKGKVHRSITNASLGAISGVAPVVIKPNSTAVTTVGGTAVATISTLEATEVIGRSTKDIIERLNYIIEKKNELQTKGDIFARKYALKSSRNSKDYTKDLDDFVALLNLKGMVALELDASWENKKQATDKAIKATFKDFSPLEESTK